MSRRSLRTPAWVVLSPWIVLAVMMVVTGLCAAAAMVVIAIATLSP